MPVSTHSNPLEGPASFGPATGPELQHCAQCGRNGTRGFRTWPATEATKPITVCAAKDACRKRWPKTIRTEA